MKIAQSAARELAPEGNHTARLIQIVDTGSEYSEKYKKSSRKLRLSFELVEETHDFGNGKGEEPFVISKPYTISLSKKANLRKDLEAWLGKKFQDKDFTDGGFDISQVVGTAGMVQIAHVESEGNVYDNILGLSSVPKGMKVKAAHNETYCFDLDSPDMDLYETFPEWLKDKIAEAPEFTQGETEKSKTDEIVD